MTERETGRGRTGLCAVWGKEGKPTHLALGIDSPVLVAQVCRPTARRDSLALLAVLVALVAQVGLGCLDVAREGGDSGLEVCRRAGARVEERVSVRCSAWVLIGEAAV